jgi:CHAD domain-containing protein
VGSIPSRERKIPNWICSATSYRKIAQSDPRVCISSGIIPCTPNHKQSGMAESTETRQFAVEQVDRLLGQLAFQISRILRPHDSNAVHHLRVAVRRFSRALLVFGPCFSSKDVKRIRRRLNEIMVPARELRNCDLAIDLLSGSKAAQVIALQARLGRQRKDAEHMLLSTLKRWMERKSSLKWRTRLQNASVAAKKNLPGTAEEAAAGMLPDLARKFFTCGRQAEQAGGTEDALHQFRIAAKKFRYTLELFTPLYGPALRVWLERVKSVYVLANGIEDCSAVDKMLGKGARGHPVSVELRKRRRKQIEEFRRQWTEGFASPDLARHWIQYLQHFTAKPPTARKPMARSTSASSMSSRSVHHA